MFGKLIKHEFRAVSRRLLPVLFLMLGMSLITGFVLPLIRDFSEKGTASFLTEKFFNTLNVVIWCVTVAAFIAVAAVSLILLIERFNSHILGNEGYTTMTLPVSVHEILWSKLLVFFFWFFAVALCVVLGILFIAGPAIKPWQWARISLDLLELKGQLPFVTAVDLFLYLLEGLAFVFISFSSFCLQVYASLIIGQAGGKHRIALAVIVFILLSAVFSTISAMLLFIANVIWDANMEAISLFMRLMHFHPAFLLILLWDALPGIICYLVTATGMKKHLNLE